MKSLMLVGFSIVSIAHIVITCRFVSLIMRLSSLKGLPHDGDFAKKLANRAYEARAD